MMIPGQYRVLIRWLEKVAGLYLKGGRVMFSKGFYVGSVFVDEAAIRSILGTIGMTPVADQTTPEQPVREPPVCEPPDLPEPETADGQSPTGTEFDDALFPETASETRAGKHKKG